ncbi:PKD domain-containing protein [Chitinophaga nivalis]|uniref:PKD domain-containing protein n=1 Tax=Chitinophaga nivalis TaxID=2991709 RepID=A0ABT3ISN7_9BACT|nr:PKD domain-containing protein [Chitinophaga nivalis]MCW3463320.1 PKD domain-containing protein [Chitinophaga nivalis]MCW3486990.1 PKD domain-containing protein [Chitinophaga nivalis]
MVQKTIIIMLCTMCSLMAQASHIIGGQVYYKFIRSSGNMYTYRISLKLYRICESGDRIAEMPAAVILSSFNRPDNTLKDRYTINRTDFQVKELNNVDPCIVNPPRVCFQVGLYETEITLPLNEEGYTIAFQSCCRDPFMVNIISDPIPNQPGDFGSGATYFIEIPGSNSNAANNSSPVFKKEEATLVCAERKFSYDFSASDPDGDQLTYELCNAYKGGQLTPQGGIPPAAGNPPYPLLSYQSPYSGSQPLGPNVTIDAKTGIISGIAPSAGKYVVTVCVNEFRNGVKIGTLRKDFHVNVTTCVKRVTAAMPEKYAECTGLTIQFINKSTPGKPYFWDFGDGTTLSTTSLGPISHTYPAAGTYHVKLYVDKNSNCGDSATAIVYAYPFFSPDFIVTGKCVQKPSLFTDRSRIDVGAKEYVKWDFGNGDTSNVPNPLYQYKKAGTYMVTMYLRSTKGCERIDTQNVTIYDKPPFSATEDTLLCAKDSLHMWATSSLPGTYSWTPDNYFILHPRTSHPIVFPKKDTTYRVTFTDNEGCTNDKDIFVDVRDSIVVHTLSDSTVCTGDEIHLYVVPDGQYTYRWTTLPSNNLISTNPDAYVTPTPPRQTYAVEAALGKCRTADTVTLKVVDPPKATAAPDTTVCYGVPLTLRAGGGSSYRWSPAYYVDEPTRPVTLAHPVDTTLFIVTVTDTLGCPKLVKDTAWVNVVPQVHAFAGNDTIIMLHTPFQLHGSGGVRYTWSPPDGLSDPKSADPITTVNRDITYTLTAYTKEGCTGTDDIFVRFIVGPEIYVPNAFSPNGDGLNDIFRPLPVGIVKMNFFRVFDRWGKLLYSSTAYLKGWDGTVNGQIAGVGTYVWVVEGLDINNRTVIRKGTVTLVK